MQASANGHGAQRVPTAQAIAAASFARRAARAMWLRSPHAACFALSCVVLACSGALGCGDDGGSGGSSGSGGSGASGQGGSSAGTGGGGSGASGQGGSSAGTGGSAGSDELDAGVTDAGPLVPPDPCATASECQRPSEACVLPACVAGVCVAQNVPAATVLRDALQTEEDCTRLECDGEGHTLAIPDATDHPVGDPQACPGPDHVDTLGDPSAAVCADTGAMAVGLWVNLFSVSEARVLLEIEQHFEVLVAFEARFVVYESDTADGMYTRLLDQRVQLTPGAGQYHGSGLIDGITLQAGKFYAIGTGVGQMLGAGTVFAETPCSMNQGSPVVSFGQQHAAVTQWQLLITMSPPNIGFDTASKPGTVLPQRLTTR